MNKNDNVLLPYLISVSLIITVEIGRTPAVYGVTNILRCWHHYSEDDQEDTCVAVVQSVNVVIIIANVNFSDITNCTDQAGGHHDCTSGCGWWFVVVRGKDWENQGY